MYSGVPLAALDWLVDSTNFASPKSRIRTRRGFPATGWIMMFSGLMSRWMICDLCAASSP